MYTKYSNIWFSNVINHACVLCVIHIHSSLSIYYDYDHDYKFFYLFCLHWARWDKPKNKKTKRLMMTLDFFLIHIIVRWTGVSSCMSCGIRVSGTVRAVSVSDCGHPTPPPGMESTDKTKNWAHWPGQDPYDNVIQSMHFLSACNQRDDCEISMHDSYDSSPFSAVRQDSQSHHFTVEFMTMHQVHCVSNANLVCDLFVHTKLLEFVMCVGGLLF